MNEVVRAHAHYPNPETSRGVMVTFTLSVTLTLIGERDLCDWLENITVKVAVK